METLGLTVEDLKELPLRAIVAWAARCARRVPPPEGRPEDDRPREAVEAALRLAEDFARGSVPPGVEAAVRALDAVRGAATAVGAAAEAAHAASFARQATDAASRQAPAAAEGAATEEDPLDRIAVGLAENTPLAALRAAEEAVAAAGVHNEALIRAADRDYRALLGLDLGRFPAEGQPVDPSPDGPLGPL